jgi:hypothetical protein
VRHNSGLGLNRQGTARKQRKSLLFNEKQLAANQCDELSYFRSRGDRIRLELFRRDIVDRQASQPNICGHVLAVLA